MRILFSRISLKDIICYINNSGLGHDLPKSVNNRVISPFCKGFIFTKLFAKFCENKTLVKISEFRVM